MSTKYFALLTHAGTSKLENAATSGTKLEITHMAVGDGGGSLPIPNVTQSKLINEKHRAEIDVLTIDPKKPNLIIAEQVLPEGQGDWWIREIGLFDKDGTLVAVGNCADLYKPQLQEQTVSMALPVSNSDWTGWVNELFSGLATRNYVREKIKDHAESRNHPDATLKEKGLVTLSNAVDSDNETHAATSKAVRTTHALAETANKNATSAIQSADSKVPLTRKVNGKELLTDIELTALDVNAYNRAETDELIGIVKKQTDTANQNATAALQSADSKVPLTRKVNNKELLTDIDLNAADVGTYNKSEIDAHINKVEQLADTANKNATSAIQNADNKVPLTRKVNGKELLTDIELNATDIGTYNKVEINEHISKVEKLAETANQNATTAIQNADSKVPLTRKVNGKELSADIQLNAADIGAYTKVETDDHINNVKTQVGNVNKLAETANHNATTAIQSADNKVPLTRKVNDKELSADIKLSA
ncbi:phage tail protein, partial [Xenorhabdus bovienii]